MLEINVGRVRELKGAPLAVLALLAISPQPVSKTWLARSSGYSDKPVKAACDYLLEQGLIDCCDSGWCLAAESQESQGVVEPEDAELVTRNISESQEVSDDLDEDETRHISTEWGFSPIWSKPQTRKNSGSRGVFLTHTEVAMREDAPERGFSQLWSRPQPRKNSEMRASLKILSLKDLKELKDLKDFKDFNTTSAAGKNRKKHKPAAGRSDPGIPKAGASGKSSQVKTEIWAELSRLGLRKNARTEALVELEHVTPAYVRALADKLDQQGYGGYRHTGLFVKVCEQGEPVQAAPALRAPLHGKAVLDLVDQFLNRG